MEKFEIHGKGTNQGAIYKVHHAIFGQF